MTPTSRRSASSAPARWATASPMSARSPASTSCSTTSSPDRIKAGHRHHQRQHGAPGRAQAASPRTSARRRSSASAPADSSTRFGDCDLVIEAATENEDGQAQDLRRRSARIAEARRHRSPPTPRRSRSPGSPPSTDRPERFIGMHFMNPVPLMELVELIRGIATDDATFEAARQLRRASSARPSRSPRISRPSSSTASCCR